MFGDENAQALHAYEHDASPLTASRLYGSELAPGVLAAQLRERAGGQVLVAAVPGGLLAPITARYSVRDLARELGVPVVLAVATGPDMVAVARVNEEVARGTGIAVPAIVLTDWPAQTPRALLDDRKLLAQIVGDAAVHALPADADARAERAGKWPAAEWLAAAHTTPPEPGRSDAPQGVHPSTQPDRDARPAPATTPAPTSSRIALEPYVEWEPDRARRRPARDAAPADHGGDARRSSPPRARCGRCARLRALQPGERRQEAHDRRARPALVRRPLARAGEQAHARAS